LSFEKPEEVNAALSELVKRINEDRRRMRMLEQSVERLENSLSALEGTALTQLSDLKLSLERTGVKADAVSARLNMIESNAAKLGKGMDKAATKLELRQIESFIDLVNPVTSKFVTKDELDRALEGQQERIRKRV
jgi:hypothetical protein